MHQQLSEATPQGASATATPTMAEGLATKEPEAAPTVQQQQQQQGPQEQEGQGEQASQEQTAALATVTGKQRRKLRKYAKKRASKAAAEREGEQQEGCRVPEQQSWGEVGGHQQRAEQGEVDVQGADESGLEAAVDGKGLGLVEGKKGDECGAQDLGPTEEGVESGAAEEVGADGGMMSGDRSEEEEKVEEGEVEEGEVEQEAVPSKMGVRGESAGAEEGGSDEEVIDAVGGQDVLQQQQREDEGEPGAAHGGDAVPPGTLLCINLAPTSICFHRVSLAGGNRAQVEYNKGDRKNNV